MEEGRKPTYEELERRVAEQDKEIAALKAKYAEDIAVLKAQIDKLTKILFGQKSEKSKKPKKGKEQKAEEPSSVPKQRRSKNGGGGRKPFPPEIPRRDVRVPLSPDESHCAFCGKEFESMGVEITEVLNYIPMVVEVIRFIRERKKASCTCRGTKIVIAEMPIRNIDKGLVTTEFIAAVLMNKYCDHLPIHRQVKRVRF